MLAYKAKLEAMESAEFEKLKNSLCSMLNERIFSVKKLWKCYWDEITDGTFCFDWKKKTAQEVEHLTKEDILALYPAFLEPSQQHCLILEYGKSKGNEYSSTSNNARLYSMEEFRSIQEYLPKQWMDYEDMSLSYRVFKNQANHISHKHKMNCCGNRSNFRQFTFKRKSKRKGNYEY